MSLEYKAVFEQEADGGFSVYVPDLPGCASQGDTYDEALANIADAVQCYVLSMRYDGLPVPPPTVVIRPLGPMYFPPG